MPNDLVEPFVSDDGEEVEVTINTLQDRADEVERRLGVAIYSKCTINSYYVADLNFSGGLFDNKHVFVCDFLSFDIDFL